MARTLDTPITQPALTKQAVTVFYTVIGYTAGVADPAKTFFEYRITTFDAAGNEIRLRTARIYLADLPAAIRSDLRSIRNKIIIDAENRTMLESGSDTEDL